MKAKEMNLVFSQYLQDNKENFDPLFSNGKDSLSGKFEIESTRPHYEVEVQPTAHLRQPFTQLSVRMLR